jgi:hypothetical protein
MRATCRLSDPAILHAVWKAMQPASIAALGQLSVRGTRLVEKHLAVTLRDDRVMNRIQCSDPIEVRFHYFQAADLTRSDARRQLGGGTRNQRHLRHDRKPRDASVPGASGPEIGFAFLQKGVDRFPVLRGAIADLERSELALLYPSKIGLVRVHGKQFLDHAQGLLRIGAHRSGLHDSRIEEHLGGFDAIDKAKFERFFCAHRAPREHEIAGGAKADSLQQELGTGELGHQPHPDEAHRELRARGGHERVKGQYLGEPYTDCGTVDRGDHGL